MFQRFTKTNVLFVINIVGVDSAQLAGLRVQRLTLDSFTEIHV